MARRYLDHRTIRFTVKYKKSKSIWVESAWNGPWNSSSLTPIQLFHSTMDTWWRMMTHGRTRTYQRAICHNIIDLSILNSSSALPLKAPHCARRSEKCVGAKIWSQDRWTCPAQVMPDRWIMNVEMCMANSWSTWDPTLASGSWYRAQKH